MKYLALLSVVFLSACAGEKIVYTPVNVDKPVEVSCHVPQIATPNFPNLQLQDSLFSKVQGLVTEIQMRKGYEAKLKAANNACE